MEEQHGTIDQVLADFDSGKLTRRNFLRSMAILGVASIVANAVSLSPLGAVKAFAAIKGAEDRAWDLAKVAAAKATKKTLTLLIPTGSIGNMTPYADKWKNELGITLEFRGQGVDEIAVVAAITGDMAPALKPGDVVMRVDPKYFRPAEVATLLGDASKAHRQLGWKPETSLREMIAEMVASDLKIARRHALLHRHGLAEPVTGEGK